MKVVSDPKTNQPYWLPNKVQRARMEKAANDIELWGAVERETAQGEDLQAAAGTIRRALHPETRQEGKVCDA